MHFVIPFGIKVSKGIK